MQSPRPLLVIVTCLFGVVACCQACIVVDDSDTEVHGSSDASTDVDDYAEECCRQVRVCETRCDDVGCYDHCETQTQCADSCERTCSGDLDCPEQTVCIDGVCTDRNYDKTGTGGLCQSCETAYDCAEPDSRCVRLYFDRTPDGGPKVCATDCEYETDCPLGFECVDRPGTPQVCVPDEKLGSTDRTCPTDPDGDYQCFHSGHCGPGQSCIDNECVAPSGECTEDADCGGSAVCQNFQCVSSSQPECIDRTDCPSDSICIDGSCKPRNPDGNCIKNAECRGDAVCVDGSCRTRCSDRSQCNANTEICREGLCVPIECRFNSDCGSNEVCVDAQCKRSCVDEGDCDSGYVCSQPGHYCKRDPSVECRTDSECLSGESCHHGTCAQVCNCNQQCGDGEICNMEATASTNTGLCESPDTSRDRTRCRNNCDCPSGQECIEGTCREPGS